MSIEIEKGSLYDQPGSGLGNGKIPVWRIILYVVGGIGLLVIILILILRVLQIGPFNKGNYERLVGNNEQWIDDESGGWVEGEGDSETGWVEPESVEGEGENQNQEILDLIAETEALTLKVKKDQAELSQWGEQMTQGLRNLGQEMKDSIT